MAGKFGHYNGEDKAGITIAEMRALRKTTKHMLFDHTINHDVL
jgi:hypothetical protein